MRVRPRPAVQCAALIAPYGSDLVVGVLMRDVGGVGLPLSAQPTSLTEVTWPC